VLLAGGIGTGLTFALTAPARTDLPGLGTPADGRWSFPALVLPALPSGASAPNGNASGGLAHAADPRGLLLPLPTGATADHALASGDGLVGAAAFAALFQDPNQARVDLSTDAVRTIAARGWTMPDGTTTRVYLLHFRSSDTASDTYAQFTDDSRRLAVAASAARDQVLDDRDPAPNGEDDMSMSQPAGSGKGAVRVGFVEAGDMVGMVVMTAPDGKAVPAVDFRQVMVLQEEMLA